MGPATRNLLIYRGDTYEFSFRLRTRVLDADGNVVDGPYIDLTGASAKAEIRDATPSRALVVAFTATIPDQGLPGNLGRVTLSLTPAQTALLPVRATNAQDVWDFQITTASGRRTTYLRGTCIYDGEVTLG